MPLCRQNCQKNFIIHTKQEFKKYFCIAKARLLHSGGSVCMAKARSAWRRLVTLLRRLVSAGFGGSWRPGVPSLIAPASPLECLLYLPNVRAIQYKLGPERLNRLGNSNALQLPVSMTHVLELLTQLSLFYRTSVFFKAFLKINSY